MPLECGIVKAASFAGAQDRPESAASASTRATQLFFRVQRQDGGSLALRDGASSTPAPLVSVSPKPAAPCLLC